MLLYIAQSGDLDRCYRCLTDGHTLKDSATQLLIKYKSGALVTQLNATDIEIRPFWDEHHYKYIQCQGKIKNQKN